MRIDYIEGALIRPTQTVLECMQKKQCKLLFGFLVLYVTAVELATHVLIGPVFLVRDVDHLPRAFLLNLLDSHLCVLHQRQILDPHSMMCSFHACYSRVLQFTFSPTLTPTTRERLKYI